MHEILLVISSFGVGITVGLTGMGGGAIMTPLLIIAFRITPLTAIASDLVAATAMKAVGAGVHARQGALDRSLILWLCAGSIPAAFAGAFLVHLLGSSASLQHWIERAIGFCLLLATIMIGVKTMVSRRRREHSSASEITAEGGATADTGNHTPLQVRRGATLAIGILGGVLVGATSVGSGSLMFVLLLLLYPSLTAGRLVGTDLAQGVPLAAAAALSHMFYGDVSYQLVAWLILGSIPGVYLGAKVAHVVPDRTLRIIIAAVLAAAGLQLLGTPTPLVIAVVVLEGITALLWAARSFNRPARAWIHPRQR